MKIFPAIDIIGGQAVRLLRGDYAEMTVYNSDPVAVALDFERQGARHIHLVDLEGARSGGTPNIETVKRIREATSSFIEIGGGVRSISVIEEYLAAGVDRVILGTAAVTDPAFLCEAVDRFGKRVAVGVDIKDGRVAIKGWTESSEHLALDFCRELESLGVATIICTDISRDGAMQGTNRELYRTLAEELSLDVIASGGVSTIDDVRALAAIGTSGAIIGKAYYTGAISIREAVEVANDN